MDEGGWDLSGLRPQHLQTVRCGEQDPFKEPSDSCLSIKVGGGRVGRLIRQEGDCTALWCRFQDNVKPVGSSFHTHSYNKHFVLALKKALRPTRLRLRVRTYKTVPVPHACPGPHLCF